LGWCSGVSISGKLWQALASSGKLWQFKKRGFGRLAPIRTLN
jgi:hypothetical protein